VKNSYTVNLTPSLEHQNGHNRYQRLSLVDPNTQRSDCFSDLLLRPDKSAEFQFGVDLFIGIISASAETHWNTDDMDAMIYKYAEKNIPQHNTRCRCKSSAINPHLRDKNEI
jgi:hypothetical protein